MLAKLLGLDRPQNYYPSPERDSFDLCSAAQWDAYLEGGVESTSGMRVTHRSAFCHPAFWQAVWMISDDAACLDYRIVKQVSSSADEEDVEDYRRDLQHPADYLLSRQANEDTPAVEFHQQLMVHSLCYGNGYALVTRELNGRPKAIYNLLPDRTWPLRSEEGDLWYCTTVGAEKVYFPGTEIVHIKGLKLSNDRGADPVTYHRDLIGLGQSAFSFASQFYRRGGRSGGILMLPISMEPQNRKLEEEKFRAAYENPDKHFKTVVTRDGVKFEPSSHSPQASQMVESRQADARDFARIFKIPPQKLGLPDAMGFASLEQSQRQYFQQALWPWVCRMRGQYELRLLSEEQRVGRTHQLAVDASSVIQLDEKVINEILEIQRRNAVINANEWRRRIGMNSRTDEAATQYVNPNTTTDGMVPDDDPTPAGDDPAPDPQPTAAVRQVVRGALERCFGRVCNDAALRATKGGVEFYGWLETFADKHRRVLAEMLVDAGTLFREQHKADLPDAHDGSAMLAAWAAEVLETVRSRLTPFIDPPYSANDLAANVTKEANSILSSEPARLADALLEMELSP